MLKWMKNFIPGPKVKRCIHCLCIVNDSGMHAWTHVVWEYSLNDGLFALDTMSDYATLYAYDPDKDEYLDGCTERRPKTYRAPS
jgi:hypothetical protein